MRNEIVHFEKGQIWVLSTGEFVYINDVDEVTKLHTSENDRRCYCCVGHRHLPKEEFKNENIFVVENEPMKSVISFDFSSSKTYTIAELRMLEAKYIGKLTEEKSKKYYSGLAGYYDKL